MRIDDDDSNITLSFATRSTERSTQQQAWYQSSHFFYSKSAKVVAYLLNRFSSLLQACLVFPCHK